MYDTLTSKLVLHQKFGPTVEHQSTTATSSMLLQFLKIKTTDLRILVILISSQCKKMYMYALQLTSSRDVSTVVLSLTHGCCD